MKGPYVVLELDGAICESVGAINWDDVGSVVSGTRPLWGTVVRLRRLLESGVGVGIVSTRYHFAFFAASFQQLRDWLGFDAGRVDFNCMTPSVEGFPAADRDGAEFSFLVESLSEDSPVCFVSGRPYGSSAAACAGVPFMTAMQFSSGAPIPGLDHYRGIHGASVRMAVPGDDYADALAPVGDGVFHD